jgi:DNA-directed RNA polymerase specialized sigma24 family protein
MHDRAWRLRRNVIRWRAKGWTVARIAEHSGVSERRVYQILAEARREIEDRQRAG